MPVRDEYKIQDTTIDDQWVGEPGKMTYLYLQGKGASQAQALRYLGGRQLYLTTGEVVTTPTPGISTIPPERLWLYPEIDEIDRHTRLGLLGRIERWAHGFKMRMATASVPSVIYPTNESGTLHHYAVDDAKCSTGQRTDIAAHKQKYDALLAHHPEAHVVLYGVSRGAAATFSAMAAHQYERVKLCILEGVPSSMSGLIKNYAARIPGFSRFGKALYNKKTAWLFLGKQHTLDKSAQARGHVDAFPNEIPLVIISSQGDWVVPLENSIRLALRVAEKRLKSNDPHAAPVYFLQLKKAGHNAYTKPNTADGIRYQAFIHAVYKQHGLPYQPHYAQMWQEPLAHYDFMSAENKAMMLQQIAFWDSRGNTARRLELRQHALQQLLEKQNQGALPTEPATFYRSMPLFSKPLVLPCDSARPVPFSLPSTHR